MLEILTGHDPSLKRSLLQPETIFPLHLQVIATENPLLIGAQLAGVFKARMSRCLHVADVDICNSNLPTYWHNETSLNQRVISSKFIFCIVDKNITSPASRHSEGGCCSVRHWRNIISLRFESRVSE
jgi:hypothetical protein